MNRLLLIICLFYMVGCNDCEQGEFKYHPSLHLSPKDIKIKTIELAIFREAHDIPLPLPPQTDIEDYNGHSIAYLDTTNIRKFLQKEIDSGDSKYSDIAFLDSYYYDVKKKRHYFLIIIRPKFLFSAGFTKIAGGYYTTDPKNGKMVDRQLKFRGAEHYFCMKIARKAFEEMIAERAIEPYKYWYSKSYSLNVIDKTVFITREEYMELFLRENNIK
ncbi:MAG: hypothetical protein EAZ55_00325 [Cytophagales bacterium]|nr:MAG: hypothetical protein EAZ55_00325 [Cytophagales bacterium]